MIINVIFGTAIGAVILVVLATVLVAVGRAADGDDYGHNAIDHFWTGLAVFVFLIIFCVFSFFLGYFILSYLGLFG